jgi:hypothetical protein
MVVKEPTSASARSREHYLLLFFGLCHPWRSCRSRRIVGLPSCCGPSNCSADVSKVQKRLTTQITQTHERDAESP